VPIFDTVLFFNLKKFKLKTTFLE